MNKTLVTLKSVCAAALIALAAGCATGNNTGRDDIAIAAGFKIVTPNNPQQKALYAKLPKGKVTPVKYHGATYYVMPDSSNGTALVGNSAQYSVYQEMRYRQHISNEDLQAAQIDELNNEEWSAWGGAGSVFVGFPP
jgi:hypothetical protein